LQRWWKGHWPPVGSTFSFPLCVYLLAVNLFQIKQYNNGILHYDRMNFAYYRAIYLNPNVTDEDRRLMGPRGIDFAHFPLKRLPMCVLSISLG
jgi:hypothetical protein